MRILHCPTHISGQMWEYAQGLRSLGVETCVLTFDRHPYGYLDDFCLNLSSESKKLGKGWKLVKNFISLIQKYDIIHFHFNNTLLPRYWDLPILRLLNKKLLMNYWGSEIRLKAIAEADNPYFCKAGGYFGDDGEKVRKLHQVARHIEVAAVADYELQNYVGSIFKRVVTIPQAIDTQQHQPAFTKPNKSVPLVVHAPSKKIVKGTSYIENAVTRLSKRYRFEFLLLHQMENQEVKKVLKEADIVVDQLLLGTYGIFSVEAMVLGKPVICYIRDDLIEKYPEDLPIVNANPDTIEIELEKLINNSYKRAEIGKQSRNYVERYHDSRVVAQRLIDLYESL